MREADLNNFSAFLAEFQGETDRGAALVGAATIDYRLAEALRAFMVTNKAATELLDGGTAPLGTFAARIKAAFAFGLIDRYEQSECDLIRKVRNEFAHGTHGVGFADTKISEFCHRLQSDLPGGRAGFKDKPRHIFINAVVLITMRLTYRAEWVAKERRVTRLWP